MQLFLLVSHVFIIIFISVISYHLSLCVFFSAVRIKDLTGNSVLQVLSFFFLFGNDFNVDL